MAFCETSQWTINFIRDRAPGEEEITTFNLNIVNGAITGDLLNADRVRISKIRGRCDPMALPGFSEAARMSFAFRFRRGAVERGIMMSGFAFRAAINARVEFQGRFRVFELDPDLPTPGTGELLRMAAGDVGDTGTGSGQQT